MAPVHDASRWCPAGCNHAVLAPALTVRHKSAWGAKDNSHSFSATSSSYISALGSSQAVHAHAHCQHRLALPMGNGEVSVVQAHLDTFSYKHGRRALASCRRLRSPPESTATRFCWSPPLKLNQPQYARIFTLRPPKFISSAPSPISSYTCPAGLQGHAGQACSAWARC